MLVGRKSNQKKQKEEAWIKRNRTKNRDGEDTKYVLYRTKAKGTLINVVMENIMVRNGELSSINYHV